MVTRVSNLVRSILVSSVVVTSINSFRRSRNFWLVVAITFLSVRAFCSAPSASRVQIIWIPSRPTCDANMFSNSSSLKAGSWMAMEAVRMTLWMELCVRRSRSPNHVSTLPCGTRRGRWLKYYYLFCMRVFFGVFFSCVCFFLLSEK